jgi:hypothetical protein
LDTHRIHHRDGRFRHSHGQQNYRTLEQASKIENEEEVIEAFQLPDNFLFYQETVRINVAFF